MKVKLGGHMRYNVDPQPTFTPPPAHMTNIETGQRIDLDAMLARVALGDYNRAPSHRQPADPEENRRKHRELERARYWRNRPSSATTESG